jgi:hypothetical protein
MNIGDKVRFVHGREEGIITKLLPNNIVEVEIEEGFKIPIRANEVTLVSTEEKLRFKPAALPEQKRYDSVEILANQGVYMAFVPINDREVAQHLINNTDWDLPFMLSGGSEPHLRGLASGVLRARDTHKVQDLLIKDFEEWGAFTFQAFFFRPAFMVLRETLVKKLKFRSNTFFKSKRKTPILEKESYLFQLDEEPARAMTIEPSKIVESMFQKEEKTIPMSLPSKPSAVVDLHIEKLTSNHTSLDNSQMMEIQMRVFEQQFEAAIANGMDEITFIHGVGNGVLKYEIQRRLSGHRNVKYFEDAQKEKFGYGATRIKIK